ncbi:MAG: mandelate racemase/muconate lactonizing enzyme family protein [Clostridiales bacterium]|jgi:L-alanine-DL-glutamate epimerase-like enolase superfamily enzyme|nr:mandelate racemase/muconate lactonizing enzyme family protein [Clostridiales bacterium]
MKITDIRAYVVDGGFRPWTFVKIETDAGLIGWGDSSDWEASFATCKVVGFLKQFLIGADPMNIEAIFWKNVNKCNRSIGGVSWKAIAGIDTALFDIKAKALGIPAWQLLGGKIRDKLELYWTHCGTGRNLLSKKGLSGKKQIKTLEDLKEFAYEVKESGFRAIKTNIMSLDGIKGGMPYGSPEKPEISSGMISNQELNTIEAIIRVFRDVCGNDLGIALDTGFTYKLGGAIKLAKRLEQFNMMWLEAESLDPLALKTVRSNTSTPIVHGESLYGVHSYRPYLESYAQDALMTDLSWNGLTMGKKIADMAYAYDVAISPHNCHSPLTTYIAANLCASIPNFFILETDVEDVPWRDDIISFPYVIKDGCLAVPERPGLGTDLNEDELIKHAFKSF